jgi:hypothetical protein
VRGGRVRVVVIRPGEPNRWGEPQGEARHVVGRCAVAPGTSTEPGAWANSVESAATLLAPYGVDLRASDEVEVEGLVDSDGNPIRWEVVGDPARWRHPGARSGAGTSVALRRVGG